MKIMKYEYTVAMIYENKRSELLQNDYNSRKRQKSCINYDLWKQWNLL